MSNHSSNISFEQSLQFFVSELFHDVQMSSVFADSKTFADATPNSSWEHIFSEYKRRKSLPEFSLSEFIAIHFKLPEPISLNNDDNIDSVIDYIQSLWPKLEKQPDEPSHCSLLPLKHPYIVPGGRFREIYYWDSYFTALGLNNSGRSALVGSMIDNFIELQNTLGCIPNGNRSYYYTRSQPPVLSLMVELVLSEKSTGKHSDQILTYYLNGLLREYQFWMQGSENLTAENSQVKRVVRLPNGAILNRFWDDSATPRAESYREDIEAAEHISEYLRPAFFRNIRAACESGWDFSSRWLNQSNKLASIRTTDIVPVDLNCLVYKLEQMIGNLNELIGNAVESQKFKRLAEMRSKAITDVLWDSKSALFSDYLLDENKLSDVKSLATVLPLFVGIASQHQAHSVSQLLEQEFLMQGGLITTINCSSQQWDSPNGWAPLQWFSVIGLKRYQYDQLAETIMRRWNKTVEQYYHEHDNIMEKYNVRDLQCVATGGEYEVQHGFGWTNGVTLAFYKLLNQS